MHTAFRKLTQSLDAHGIAGSVALCLRLPFAPILRSEFGTRMARAYHGWTFDRKYGVETGGFIKPGPDLGADADLGIPYDGTNPNHFRRIIQGLGIRYEDFSFVDFGSGKGRVLLMASSFPFRSISGVEWSSDLHETALRNIRAYRGPMVCEEVKSYRGDAGEFPIPEGKCLLYFFNPFKDPIMTRVVENVKRSFEADPREIVMVYVNPQSRAIFERASFLEKVSDHGWFVVYRTVMSAERFPQPNPVTSDLAPAKILRNHGRGHASGRTQSSTAPSR